MSARTAADILGEFNIHPPSFVPGRYYTTCPQCSASRSRAHQHCKVLGITIDDEGVQWGCNHCSWTGGGYYNRKGNGQARGDACVAAYDYRDENGELLFQVVRKAGKKFLQTKDVRKTLYRLPELVAAIEAGETILVAEGESAKPLCSVALSCGGRL